MTGYADAYPGKVIEDCEMIDSKVKQKLLFENGMKFLGLDSSQFLWKYANLWQNKKCGKFTETLGKSNVIQIFWFFRIDCFRPNNELTSLTINNEFINGK